MVAVQAGGGVRVQVRAAHAGGVAVAAVVAGGVGAIGVTLLWAKWFPELRLARSFDPPNIGGDLQPKEKAT